MCKNQKLCIPNSNKTDITGVSKFHTLFHVEIHAELLNAMLNLEKSSFDLKLENTQNLGTLKYGAGMVQLMDMLDKEQNTCIHASVKYKEKPYCLRGPVKFNTMHHTVLHCH